MAPCLRTSSGRQADRSDDDATVGASRWAEGSSSLVRLGRRITKRRAKRSLKLGCASCGEFAVELPAEPFSRSRGRLRGEDLYLYENMGLPKENRRSVGESGEKRERSKKGSGSGGGTPIDGCSLVLEEARVL